MDHIYLSRSIRARAKELLKKLNVDVINVDFGTVIEYQNFKSLCEQLDETTNKLGPSFAFCNESFNYILGNFEFGASLRFTNTTCDFCERHLKAKVSVHSSYFFGTFPEQDQKVIHKIIRSPLSK